MCTGRDGGALYAADALPPGVTEGPTCIYDHHSSPTWEGKHHSTVTVSVVHHRMHAFKAHCSDVICIQLLMWGLKSQAEI